MGVSPPAERRGRCSLTASTFLHVCPENPEMRYDETQDATSLLAWVAELGLPNRVHHFHSLPSSHAANRRASCRVRRCFHSRMVRSKVESLNALKSKDFRTIAAGFCQNVWNVP